MGTSGAYGGSAEWNDTRRDTEDWLGSGPGAPGSGSGQDGPDDSESSADAPPFPHDTTTLPARLDGIDPRVARILAGVAGRLAGAAGGASASGGGGGRRVTGGASGGGGGSGGRSRSAALGGVAVGGAYGLRSRDAGAIAELGLSLTELDGLSPFQQAQRLVDAASGPSALIAQDEIREVNANFMLWAVQQDQTPSPADLVKAWVTEFVYRSWLTEAGSVLRDGTRDGAATHALEREVRVTLEAAVSRVELPASGLRAANFHAAINQLLGTLGRIFAEAAA